MGERTGETGSVVGSNSTVASTESDGSRSAHLSSGQSDGNLSGGPTNGSIGSESGGGSSTSVNSPPSPKSESFTSPVELLKPPTKDELQSLAILNSYIAHKRQTQTIESAIQMRQRVLNKESKCIHAAKEEAHRARISVLKFKDEAKHAQKDSLAQVMACLIEAIEEEDSMNTELINRQKVAEDEKAYLAMDEKRRDGLTATMASEKAKLMAFTTIGVSSKEQIIEILEDSSFENVKCFAIIPPMGSDASVLFDLVREAALAERTFERRTPARPPSPPV